MPNKLNEALQIVAITLIGIATFVVIGLLGQWLTTNLPW